MAPYIIHLHIITTENAKYKKRLPTLKLKLVPLEKIHLDTGRTCKLQLGNIEHLTPGYSWLQIIS